MRASITLSELTISDSTKVALPEKGVVLFVGPNNAGKSQALRDLAKIVTSQDSGVVILEAKMDHSGTSEDLLETLQQDQAIVRSATSGDRVDLGKSGKQPVGNVLQWWSGGNYHIVSGYFVLLADTETRLLASKPAPALNLYDKDPVMPAQRLYERRDIETRLDQISREAFGRGLVLDTWAGGSEWALRVGEIEAPVSPRPDQGFLDSLKALPLLHQQGDGVRSMIGLLLTLLTGHQTISLIDEPEAFLHPPQARFLAKILSEDALTTERLVVLGTHSSDIVHGVLEGDAPTTVVRIVRDGEVNRASVLDNEAVRRLWSDPLLRYSNLLEGLFTDAVIVCESEADCKFFASIRDTLEQKDGISRRPDVLFTSCGGKHRMRVGVEALRAASVPVSVVGDFDVLNDWSVLERLISAAGGVPDQFRSDWRILDAALQSDSRTPSVVGLKEAVKAAMDGLTNVSTKSLRPVRDALKIETGWDRVKNTGVSGVPKGGPHKAAQRLLERLATLGIFLIPVGEMEDFVPDIAHHGSMWVSGVLESRLHESAEAAQEFLSSVLASLP